MTTYNGYTYDLSHDEREANRKIATEAIQHDLQARTLKMAEPLCCCLEIQGDNPNCPLHGKMFRSDCVGWNEEVEAQRDARDLGTFARGG